MEKVLILSVADSRHMSMISPYLTFFDSNNIPYDIIRTNRYGSSSQLNDDNIYEFSFGNTDSMSKIKKLFFFLKFRRYAYKIIKENNYFFVVVWNENTATLFFDILQKKFKNRYCINIRDLISDMGLLKNITMATVNNSVFTTIPSPAIIDKFSKNTIVLLNQDTRLLSIYKKKDSFSTDGDPLRLTYLGLCTASVKTFHHTMDAFGGDPRFILNFYGNGSTQLLKPYAIKKNYKNINFGDEFPYEKTATYLQDTDIINSYYNNEEINHSLKYAVGVKHSYSPLLYIPSIVDADTYWGNVCKKYGFGFPVQDIFSLPDMLYDWYHSLNFLNFVTGCNEYNRYVKKTNEKFFELCKVYFK